MTAVPMNGSAPPTPAFTPEAKLVAELHELIANERELRAEPEKLIAESKDRERRYERALTAIQGPDKPARPARPTRARRTRDSNDWTISPAKVEEVYERFAALRAEDAGAVITPTYIADNTPGLSPDTVRRALAELREQERVRIAGKTRGGGSRFELMPEPADDA